MKNFYALIFSLFLCGILMPASAQAENNILFILDGSNSMWGQVDGEAKITSAQNVMSDLLKDLPASTKAGFMVYGHREEGSCEDIEVLSGIGEVSSGDLITKIKALKPKGKTPVAASLKKSLDVLSKFEGDNNNVVLISDGVETCDGDPCAAAKALADAGINARVHVVGFDIGEDERKKLSCIPEMGNGKYFSASNAAELKEAVAEVKEAAVKAPEPPKFSTYFEDNFDGDELADHWEILNPNPDAFIVENGVLTVIASSEATISGKGDLPNIFRLTKELPKGDWVATMRFIPEVSTFREIYGMGLHTDEKNMLMGTLGNRVVCCDNAIDFRLWGEKISKGQKTNFDARIMKSPGIGGFPRAAYTDWTHNNERAVELRMEKIGRSYVLSARVEGDLTSQNGTESEWISLQKLTSLRPPGNALTLAFNQMAGGHPSYTIKGGESIINVEWVKIEVKGSNPEPAAGE